MPFIKLFCTPNNYYFLDVNKNKFIEISELSFEYLKRQLEGNDIKEKIPDEICRLKEAGYLSEESNVKYIKHMVSDYLEVFLKRRLLKLTLQVTQNCNFKCRYCVYSEENNKMQHSHSSKNMSWRLAKDAINFLWSHSVDSSSVNIGFYGGEPLLQMPLIKSAIEYSEKLFKGKKPTFNITTNGTLLDEEKILYFQKHNVFIMISLDGPQNINDKNRIYPDGTGTYDSVIEKINLIRKVAPEYAEKLQISMVMDPENDFDCINCIYLQEDDFNKLNIAPAIVDKECDKEETKFSNDYTWKYRYQRFLAILSYLNRYEEEKISPIVRTSVNSDIEHRFDFENTSALYETDASAGPCITGQARLFCNVDGNSFPCERVSETSPSMCIGTIEKGFNLENAKRFLNVGALTENMCKTCLLPRSKS